MSYRGRKGGNYDARPGWSTVVGREGRQVKARGGEEPAKGAEALSASPRSAEGEGYTRPRRFITETRFHRQAHIAVERDHQHVETREVESRHQGAHKRAKDPDSGLSVLGRRRDVLQVTARASFESPSLCLNQGKPQGMHTQSTDECSA